MWIKFRNTNFRLVLSVLLLWMAACTAEVREEPAGSPAPPELTATLPGTQPAQPAHTATASPVTPATALPSPTMTASPSPAPTLTATPTLADPTATPTEAFTSVQRLEPSVTGQVSWQDTLLVDIPAELPACYPDIP
ncbi:MAG: hypothetical protein KDE59_30375, partial [Anaerolineales bacterium]|nr:hypothetical protein [Anaerolineales bacterium]